MQSGFKRLVCSLFYFGFKLIREPNGIIHIGPAHYLSELIPKSASASAPSIPILRSMLHRANLRVEIIALAGIILDTLSSQFVRKWRTELSRYSLWEDGGRCEVLALCALGISMKFLDDKVCFALFLLRKIGDRRLILTL